MESPTFIKWNSPFLIEGMLGGIFHFHSNFNRTFWKQTVETLIRQPRCAASGLDLHYLNMSHKQDDMLICVNS